MANSLYQQIAERVLSRILSGEYPIGSQIPTENELASTMGVSRPTVRQALNQLTQEGYLVRVKGRGTFVTQPKVLHESTSFITGYRAESERKHRRLHTRILDLQILHPEESVARALEISPNEKVTRLIRLRHLENYNHNAPVVYTVLYVPYLLFPDMCDMDFTHISFYETLTERGLEVKHSSKKLEVIPPPAEVAAALTISPFEPVIFITSCGRMASTKPIEYAESYYPAGTSSFLIDVQR